jgi:hypothetical protein
VQDERTFAPKGRHFGAWCVVRAVCRAANSENQANQRLVRHGDSRLILPQVHHLSLSGIFT